MTVDNYLAEAGALAGLAGVLAGFSLAAVVQLLTVNNESKLAGWIRSRVAGILTTTFAVISICMITYAISNVLSLFM